MWQRTPVSTLNPCNKYLAKHCHSTLTTFGLLPAVVKVKVFVILFWFAHLGFDDSHLSTQRYLLIIFPSHIFLPMSFCFGYLFICFFACLVGWFCFCLLAPSTTFSHCTFFSFRVMRFGVGCIYLFVDLHHTFFSPRSISPELVVEKSRVCGAFPSTY